MGWRIRYSSKRRAGWKEEGERERWGDIIMFVNGTSSSVENSARKSHPLWKLGALSRLVQSVSTFRYSKFLYKKKRRFRASSW